jgi:hypothetical protein
MYVDIYPIEVRARLIRHAALKTAAQERLIRALVSERTPKRRIAHSLAMLARRLDQLLHISPKPTPTQRVTR